MVTGTHCYFRHGRCHLRISHRLPGSRSAVPFDCPGVDRDQVTALARLVRGGVRARHSGADDHHGESWLHRSSRRRLRVTHDTSTHPIRGGGEPQRWPCVLRPSPGSRANTTRGIRRRYRRGLRPTGDVHVFALGSQSRPAQLSPRRLCPAHGAFVRTLLLGAAALLATLDPLANLRLLLVLFVLPPSIAALGFAPNLLATAMALIGTYFVRRPTPRPVLGAAFIALGLCAHTSIIAVPIALAIAEVVANRRLTRAALWLGASLLPSVGVSLFVEQRFGGVSEFAARASGRPFAGIATSVPTWTELDIVMVALLVGLVTVAMIRRRAPIATWISLATVATSTVYSSQIWGLWWNFARVLLPAYTFAIIALADRSTTRPTTPSATSLLL